MVAESQIFVIKKSALKMGELNNQKVVIVSYEIGSKLIEEFQNFQTALEIFRNEKRSTLIDREHSNVR